MRINLRDLLVWLAGSDLRSADRGEVTSRL